MVYEPNVLLRLRAAAKEVFVQLNAFFTTSTPAVEEYLRHRTWVLYNTKNQFDSLSFLQTGLQDVVFVSHEPRAAQWDASGQTIILPYYAAVPLRYVLNYLPIMWRTLYRQPKHFARMFHYFVRGIGQFEVFSQFLARYQPRAIIIGNDHSVHCRAMMHAGNQAGIPTVFFQHASVMSDFPPMRFAHACVEGQDTLDKFMLIDPETQTKFHLVGMPKLDHFFSRINDKERVEVLGIPFGPDDSLDDIARLTSYILMHCSGLRIRVRKHPADPRTVDLGELPSSTNTVELSNPVVESAFDYLGSVDMIINGSSSIHLEAVLLNVVSLYFTHSEIVDLYAYVANGLVDRADNYSEVVRYIQHNQTKKETVRHRAKYYYAPLGTPYDGHSAELSRKVIASILAKPESGETPATC
ncbi:hypothetical protein [Neolewinella sp.]|uniref:hypothetical protein n=1 Tax=Neolewinella sp. TaxID=2993543 RepID=UPI003B523F4E